MNTTITKSLLNTDSILYLEKIVGKDNICSILQKYIDSYTDIVKNLNDACTDHNTKEMKRLAHSLKSSSMQVGAERLSSLCKDLEEGSEDYNFKISNNLISEIGVEFNTTSLYLKEIIDKYKKNNI